MTGERMGDTHEIGRKEMTEILCLLRGEYDKAYWGLPCSCDKIAEAMHLIYPYGDTE